MFSSILSGVKKSAPVDLLPDAVPHDESDDTEDEPPREIEVPKKVKKIIVKKIKAKVAKTPSLPVAEVAEANPLLDELTPTPNDASDTAIYVPQPDVADVTGAKTKPGGKGGKGKGLSGNGAKRHKKITRASIEGISKPEIRRLARRGGVKRIGGEVYVDVREALKAFLVRTIGDSITYCEHARRRTLTAKDVVYALKRQGTTLYM